MSEKAEAAVCEVGAGRWLVELAGDLDPSNVAQVVSAVARVPAGSSLVVDLSRVTFLDSSVLEVLLKAHFRLRSGGKQVTLIVPPRSPAARILELTGVGSVFVIHESLQTAGQLHDNVAD